MELPGVTAKLLTRAFFLAALLVLLVSELSMTSVSASASEQKTSMPIAPFRNLLYRHLRNNRQSSGTVTLATVEAGKPRARTVLFQGLSERRQGTLGVCVKMSKHSRKVRNADSPAVEVVWWLQETGVQFRLSGTISYDDQAERVRVWNSLGAGAKSQFFYDADQGLDSSTSGALFQEEEEQRSRQGLVAVPDSFVVGVVFPTEVDFLDLNTLQRINWQAVNGDPHAAEGWEEVKGFAPPVVSTVPTAVNTKTGISNKDEL